MYIIRVSEHYDKVSSTIAMYTRRKKIGCAILKSSENTFMCTKLQINTHAQKKEKT